MRRIVVMAALIALVAGVLHAGPEEKVRYGNWCGKEYPKDTKTAPAPVNRVDQECMKHDLAYETNRSRADSDAELVKNLTELANSGEIDGEELAWAVSIAAAFTGLQYRDLHKDLLDGKVSTAVDVAVATGVSIAVLPTAATAGVIAKVGNEVGGPLGKPISWTADVVRFSGVTVISGGKVADKVQAEASRAWRRIKSWF